MENRKDYEKRLGERLEAAYMQEDIGPVMSREEFHRLIQTAEKKKKHRRTMLSLAAACVALCLVCGGFVAGMTMRESASAGKDDETKTVQQGGSVVIGSGVSQNDQNVGVSTKTYTNIEDIPEDIRKEIHFLDSDEFKLEKVVILENKDFINIEVCYLVKGQEVIIKEELHTTLKNFNTEIKKAQESWMYKDKKIYRSQFDGVEYISLYDHERIISISIPTGLDVNIEVVLDDLIN